MKKRRFFWPTIFTTIALVLLIFIRVSPSIVESDSFALNAQLLAAVFGIVGGLIGIGKYYSEMLGDNNKEKASDDNEDNESTHPDDDGEADPDDSISLTSDDKHDTDKTV